MAAEHDGNQVTDQWDQICVHDLPFYWRGEERIHMGTGDPCLDYTPSDDTETAQMPRVEDRPMTLADLPPSDKPFALIDSTPVDPVFGFHDEGGRSLIEFRIRDGKLEAKYYPSDLDNAAQKFVAYLREHYSS